MLAFERLLELHPEHREQAALLQIAVPSRIEVAEYQQLKRSIDELVGRINGRFATANWSPIRYLYRSVDPVRLCSLYRDADVALVTDYLESIGWDKNPPVPELPPAVVEGARRRYLEIFRIVTGRDLVG